jgi:hypothetical protein
MHVSDFVAAISFATRVQRQASIAASAAPAVTVNSMRWTATAALLAMAAIFCVWSAGQASYATVAVTISGAHSCAVSQRARFRARAQKLCLSV